jgi:hypothetical protein
MLIFFIHGVATRNVQYADALQKSLKQASQKLNQPAPIFYASFWGNALSDMQKVWNYIDQDLQILKRENPQIEIKDSLRYRSFREDFLSQFAGDLFTYLNPQRGLQIRQTLAQQLIEFLKENPTENELHIICHSLGTVILWDILFSDRFTNNDPAHTIRRIIRHLSENPTRRTVNLKTITTMGSPILFLNTMLAVNPQSVKDFSKKQGNSGLKWLNLIDPSDLIAYPLKSSFELTPTDNLKVQDIYVETDINMVAMAARSLGQDMASMALEAGKAHEGYFHSPRVAELILDHIHYKTIETIVGQSSLNLVIERLKAVKGMTEDKLKIHINDEPKLKLTLSDGSGVVFHVVNAAKVHHVYLFDRQNICQFAGYVGWLDTKYLEACIESIQTQWCDVL